MPACPVSPRIMLAEFISSILTQASGRAEHCTRPWFLPFPPKVFASCTLCGWFGEAGPAAGWALYKRSGLSSHKNFSHMQS